VATTADLLGFDKQRSGLVTNQWGGPELCRERLLKIRFYLATANDYSLAALCTPVNKRWIRETFELCFRIRAIVFDAFLSFTHYHCFQSGAVHSGL
jgi:hypothetical protein